MKGNKTERKKQGVRKKGLERMKEQKKKEDRKEENKKKDLVAIAFNLLAMASNLRTRDGLQPTRDGLQPRNIKTVRSCCEVKFFLLKWFQLPGPRSWKWPMVREVKTLFIFSSDLSFYFSFFLSLCISFFTCFFSQSFFQLRLDRTVDK